jgi:hypothetical protein
VVIVVTRTLAALEEQERDLNALSLEVYDEPLERLGTVVAEERADIDAADISDEELFDLVHDPETRLIKCVADTNSVLEMAASSHSSSCIEVVA